MDVLVITGLRQRRVATHSQLKADHPDDSILANVGGMAIHASPGEDAHPGPAAGLYAQSPSPHSMAAPSILTPSCFSGRTVPYRPVPDTSSSHSCRKPAERNPGSRGTLPGVRTTADPRGGHNVQ